MTAFDQSAVEAEIREAVGAYEHALGTNDITTLSTFFWEDPRVVRLSPDGGLYGHQQISDFRRARDISDIEREVTDLRILVLGPDSGVATCEYRRTGSGRRGAQSQVWKRTPEGWRIVVTHVSLNCVNG